MPPKRKTPEAFRPIDNRIYSRNRCFFCAKLLRSKTSREHVFPKWLQEKFDLRDQTIHFLNGTTIQYSKLTVPCCNPCNTIHLSKLENRVKRLLFEEPISVARRNSSDIWIWVMKILLGIVYAERILPLRRSKPSGRRIFPSEMKDSLRTTHFFVQQLNLKIRFEAEGQLRVPGSIFIFNLKKYPNPINHFHFRDDMGTLSVFMRLGNRGIIAMSDGGAMELDLGAMVKRDAAVKLHPVQFDEMGARLFYKSSLFNRTPKYITMHMCDGYHVIQMPIGGLSPKPIFDPWDHPTYAHYLAAFMGTVVERVTSPDGSLVSTWLYDRDNKRVRIPIGAK